VTPAVVVGARFPTGPEKHSAIQLTEEPAEVPPWFELHVPLVERDLVADVDHLTPDQQLARGFSPFQDDRARVRQTGQRSGGSKDARPANPLEVGPGGQVIEEGSNDGQLSKSEGHRPGFWSTLARLPRPTAATRPRRRR
jgi:hypothetical protein